MVHARKNNRRRVGTKVTRRPKTYRMKRVFGHPEVAAAWNVHQTARQNLQALGLVADPNTDSSIVRHSRGLLADEVEWVTLDPAAEAAAAASLSYKQLDRNHRRPEHWVSEEETEYLRRLVAKYGEDVARAARDTKLNHKQHTAEHLATRMARLRRHEAAQQATAAPSGSAAAPVLAGSAAPAPAPAVAGRRAHSSAAGKTAAPAAAVIAAGVPPVSEATAASEGDRRLRKRK